VNPAAIPSTLMHQLIAGQELDNREVVINYLVSQKGTVELSELQKDLLDRWETADDLIRSNRYKLTEVARVLEKKYQYGLATARRDIADAQYVFNSTNKKNKGYLLALHLDRIDAAIILAMQQNSRLLPLLFAEYTRAWKELPDDEKGSTTPAAIIFNFTTNHITQLTETEIANETAKAIADKYLKEKGITVDLASTEFEDVTI
jgi:hypothetical protein